MPSSKRRGMQLDGVALAVIEPTSTRAKRRNPRPCRVVESCPPEKQHQRGFGLSLAPIIAQP